MTILFPSHNNRSITNALMLVNEFEHISGLCMNMTRSGLAGINIANSTVSNLAEAIGCKNLACPITCLGIPLGSNPRCKSF